MKHHHPVRALSLLCALAIFVSLLPAALAAGLTEDQLKDHILTDTVTPAGIQINLFDYWVDAQSSNDNNVSATTNTGINKDHNLRFVTDGHGEGINAWTETSSPHSGIVKNTLDRGYPVLKSGQSTNDGTTTEESLDYLFDQSEQIDATTEDGTPTGTLGKKTYWDVGGLLRIDDDGYYYYNADYSMSKADGGSYQSANYAYFNEATNSFTVYDTYGIKKAGAGSQTDNQKGQFFPFNSPTDLDIFTVTNNKLEFNESINSKNSKINHFFGVSMTTRFIQRYGGKTAQANGKDMTFEFSGDDDVWIFIDGVLVADLGGIHNQASTSINFATGAITINGKDAGTLKGKMSQYYSDAKYPGYWNGNTFKDDTYHTLKLFYLERGGTDSNLAMKFNLAYVPETDGIKVDQFGKRLSGVQFDLYAATKDKETGAYTVDDSKGDNKDGRLASGTTDSNGRFVLNDSTGGHISLNELTDKHKVDYLILQEQPKGREGYRRDENIYLVLTSNGTVSILFNDMEHRWTTGTYAGLKGSISTSESVQLINADRTNYVPGTAVTDEDGKTLIDKDGKAHLAAGGTLFAVIMRRLDNVGTSVPSDSDTWGVVTGSALSGWTVYERVTGQVGYRKAVINALKAGAADNGNAVAFKLTTNGAYMAELKYCPGDLREYYYWTGNSVNNSNDKDTAYSVAFFYTTGDLAKASLDNTYPVDGSGFERQFAATIYIPNVKHYLNVQKVDETGTAVPKATFSLYKKDDLTITGTGWSVKEGKSAYDTVITGTDGKAQFPSAGKGVLAEGQYYLVEDSAPVGYKVNATAVPVIVDDTHGVMADAGTDNDGVAVTVAEGHLVPTMTPFATVDDIDRTLTNITTTKETAASGWANTSALQKTENKVKLKLDTESFNKDLPVQTLRYIPVDGKNKSLSWRTETGWLWFHIEQTPIADNDPDKKLKTNLGNRDLTRLFTGETTVIVTNQRVGTLAVSKTVDNTTTEDLSSNSYKIEIGLNDETYSGIVNCTSKIGTADATNVPLTFASGKVTYWIKGGEKLTLLDLPVGTAWTVEETEPLNSNNWEATVTSTGGTVTNKVASGKIKDTNQNDTVDITNTYVEPDPEDAVVENALNVRKQYAEGSSGYENVVTKFKIQSNTAGAPMPNPAEISITGQGTGSFGTLEFTKAGTYTYTVSEVNGGVNGMTYAETVYTVTFEVERGTGSDRNKLVARPTYRVVEKTGDASKPYLYTDTTGLLFTNTYNPGSSEEQDKGSLSIHKTLENPKNATTGLPARYEIKITLSHYDGISSSSQIGSSEPQSVTLTFGANGIATYRIQAGETLTLSDLPVGTQWTVTETAQLDSKYWRTAYKVNGQDATTVSDGISAANETDAVIITNTYTPNGGEIVPGGTGALSISKKIGEGIAATTEFDFTVAVSGASGNYSATLNGADTTVTFENGSAAVKKLKGGDTLVIKGLPAGASYTVTEQNADKYNVTYDPAAPDKIVKDETVTCHVTNELKNSKPDTGSLTIRKTVGEGIDTSFDFQFSVTLTYPNQTRETRTLTVPANDSVTISDLPVGTFYDVTETTTGYTVTATNATGSIPVGGTTAAFHNALTGGGDDGPGPGPNPGGDDGGTPALNRRDHYAYIIGYPDGDVHPQGNITRAEVATIFFRLLRDPVRTQYWSQTNDYPDVAFNKWYNNAISTLTNMGIICGYPDGFFRPDAPITRAELTKIAASFFSDPRVAATYDGRFSDVQGAEWYISYLMTAIKEGLIEGYPDGSFRPNRPITRAETCTIVNRTLGRKPEKDHLLPESDMINWPDNINRNIWYYAQMQEATNSHDYRWASVYSEVCEQWTAKLIERDWAALERTWSHANSAPGGEVMQ